MMANMSVFSGQNDDAHEQVSNRHNNCQSEFYMDTKHEYSVLFY